MSEWMILIVAAVVLYLTGWHTEVIGRMQQLLLITGFFQPKITINNNAGILANHFALIDLYGNIFDSEVFQGKTLFINIWATWCPPCVAELPDIQRLYDKLGSGEIVFLMINLDQDFETAKSFVKRKGFTFPVYRLLTRLPEQLNTRTIPSTYVIAPDGKILVARHGMAKYNTRRFRKYLKETVNDDGNVAE